MKDHTSIFVVDDDEALRASLHWLLASLKVKVETYASAQEFLVNYVPGTPGCLVLDVRMPETSGLELQAILRERGIVIPVIVITGHADVSMAVRAMRTGALDFLEKPFHDQDLLERVQQALKIDAHRWLEEEQQRSARNRLSSLTSREHEVMEKVVGGKPNKIIAAELGISMKTVEVHRARVMGKLEVRSPFELASVYISSDLHEDKSLAGPGKVGIFQYPYA